VATILPGLTWDPHIPIMLCTLSKTVLAVALIGIPTMDRMYAEEWHMLSLTALVIGRKAYQMQLLLRDTMEHV